MTNAHRSLFFASLTILSWSTVSTAFKLSLAAMTPLQMIAVSMTVGGLVFALVLAVAALRGELHSFRSSDAAGAVIAGPVIAVYYFVLFQGYSLLPAQVAQPINYTWSIVLAIMLCVAHREPLSVRQVFWMLTAWAGAALIAAGGRDIGHISPAGIGLMIFFHASLPSFLAALGSQQTAPGPLHAHQLHRRGGSFLGRCPLGGTSFSGNGNHSAGRLSRLL